MRKRNRNHYVAHVRNSFYISIRLSAKDLLFFNKALYGIKLKKKSKFFKKNIEKFLFRWKRKYIETRGDTILLRFCWNFIFILFYFIQQIWQIFCAKLQLRFVCTRLSYFFLFPLNAPRKFRRHIKFTFLLHERNFADPKYEFTEVVSLFRLL